MTICPLSKSALPPNSSIRTIKIMQPRNSFEQQIEEAGRTLRPISARQIRWAFDRCFVRYGRRTTKGVITCTECGHAWRDKTARKHCICPSCHTRLTIDDNHLRRIYDTANYALFMTVHNGMQASYIWPTMSVSEKERNTFISKSCSGGSPRTGDAPPVQDS